MAGFRAFQGRVGGYAAVLMDCQMPHMDGYDSTRAIRSFEDGRPRTPIIAMTASAIAGERERCLASGMDDFLTKPVDVTLLRETLDRWVAAPNAGGPPEAPETGSGTDSHALASLADASVLARDRLEELLDLDPGDPTMLLRFIDRFGDNARRTLGSMREAQRSADAEALGRAAHGLKGSAANLGATQLAEVCKQVEYLGDDGVVADDEALDGVDRALAEAVVALEAFALSVRPLS